VANGAPVPGRVLYSAAARPGGDPLLPFWPAPNWLIYSAPDGSLHGRSYDGALDVPLPWDATGFALLPGLP
jgi:hypothetical protein